jgi:hypothetical protein
MRDTCRVLRRDRLIRRDLRPFVQEGERVIACGRARVPLLLGRVGTADLVLSSAQLLFRVRLGETDADGWKAIGWTDLSRVTLSRSGRRASVAVNLLPRPGARLASIDPRSGRLRHGAADAILDPWFVMEMSPSLASSIVGCAGQVGAAVDRRAEARPTRSTGRRGRVTEEVRSR